MEAALEEAEVLDVVEVDVDVELEVEGVALVVLVILVVVDKVGAIVVAGWRSSLRTKTKKEL